MFLAKSPKIVKKYYSSFIWDLPNNENKIYLTFDDGPTPEITNHVLNILKEYKIKATFFCVGNNVKRYPELFNKIKAEGHSFGNHTYNHSNGWKNDDSTYIKDVEKCEKAFESKLFRPPYGKIKKSQAKMITQDHKIIMWDVLSGDFDIKTPPEKCLENVIENVKSGSIVVFHDSVKAFANLQYTLPKAIEYLLKKGFVFDKIPTD